MSEVIMENLNGTVDVDLTVNRINPNSTVRRRLFQDDNEDEVQRNDDHENYTNTVIEQLRRDRETMTRKYNFDFLNEQPLPGNYDWVRVEPETTQQIVEPAAINDKMDCDDQTSSEVQEVHVQEDTPKKSPLNQEKE